jgi:hypothetical protein
VDIAVDIALRADSEQWLVHDRQILLSTKRMHLNLYIRTYNSLNLSLNSFSSRPFVLPNLNPYARIPFLLFSLYNARTLKYFFSILRN